MTDAPIIGLKINIKNEADYQAMSDLLGRYGNNLINDDAFWRLMNARGWGQADIDQWCSEHYRREAEEKRGGGWTRPALVVTDATIVGPKIQPERMKDRPCGCGQTMVAIKEGASLYCTRCDRHRGELPEKIAEFLLATVARFGRLSGPIVIRDSEMAFCDDEILAPDDRCTPELFEEQHQEEGD